MESNEHLRIGWIVFLAFCTLLCATISIATYIDEKYLTALVLAILFVVSFIETIKAVKKLN